MADHRAIVDLFGSSDETASELRMAVLETLTNPQTLFEAVNQLHLSGVDRVRYYHVTQRQHAGRRLVLLCQASEAEDTISPSTRIDWSQTIFCIRGQVSPWTTSESAAAIELFDGSEFPPEDRERLGLRDRAGLSVLVTTNKSAGLLVLDWDKPKQWVAGKVSSAERIFLILYARWVLGLALNPQVDNSESYLTHSSNKTVMGLTEDETLERLNDLRQTARAAVLAYFEYDWRTGRLTKQWEAASSAFPDLEPMPEIYLSGEYHTGIAWSDSQRRMVVDLAKDTDDGHPDGDVFGPSLKRHQAWLGDPGAVLYARMASKGDGKLLRLIHRIDQPAASFGPVRQSLERKAQDLGAELDRARLEQLMEDLLQLGHAASFSARGVRKLRDAAASILRRRNIPWVAFLHHIDSETVELWSIHAEGRDDPESVRAVAEFPVLKTPEGQDFVAREELPGHYLNWLESADSYFRVVVDSPLETQMFVPVELSHSSPERTMRRSNEEFATLLANPASDMRMLSTFTELAALGRTVARFNDEGADFATGYARFMAHELLSRVNRIANVAGAALNDGADEVELGLELDTVEEDLRRSARVIERMNLELQRYLRPAVMLRRGSMTVERVPLRIETVVDGAIAEVSDRFSHEFCKQWSIRPFVVVLHHHAGVAATGLVADSAVLTQALVAMLDNAIKYSNPARTFLRINTKNDELVRWAPHRQSPGRVVLRGPAKTSGREPVSVISLVLRVDGPTMSITAHNWGVPVPDDIEGLWQPFERGGVKDPRRTVPGLGIGLPLVSTAAIAHLGDARLESSPTLSDERIRDQHGWSTTCTLSVSLTLSAGMAEVSFEDPGR